MVKVCKNCKHVCHCNYNSDWSPGEHKRSYDCDCESCDCEEEEYCAYTDAMKARLEDVL